MDGGPCLRLRRARGALFGLQSSRQGHVPRLPDGFIYDDGTTALKIRNRAQFVARYASFLAG